MSKAFVYKVIKVLLILITLFWIWYIYRFFHFFYLEDLFAKHAIAFYFGAIIPPACLITLIKARDWIYEKRLEMALVFCIFIIGMASIELALRIVDKKPLRLDGHPYLNFHGVPNYTSVDGMDKHNSFGFRGEEVEVPKPEGTYRIVALGGSTTYTTGVKNWKESYPYLLQTYLRENYNYEKIEVINAGIHSYTSLESLINLQVKVLTLEPDMIIIYHGINDLAARMVSPESYKSDNTGARKQFKKPICFYQKCSAVWSRLIGESNKLPVDTPTNYYRKEDSSGKIEDLGLYVSELLEINKPIYFERNLRSIISISETFGIKTMIVTWTHGNIGYLSKDYVKNGINEQNDMLRSLSKEYNIHLFDFEKVMPVDRKYWSSDGMHVNTDGAILKAELFVKNIVDSGIIKNDIENLKK